MAQEHETESTKRRTQKQAEKGKEMYEDAFDFVRNAAEANLEMQREIFRYWSGQWSNGVSRGAGEKDWTQVAREAQCGWNDSMRDVMNKSREAMVSQYQGTMRLMEDAVEMSQCTNPDEFRRRSQSFCRDSLDTMKRASEAYLESCQSAVRAWTDCVTRMR